MIGVFFLLFNALFFTQSALNPMVAYSPQLYTKMTLFANVAAPCPGAFQRRRNSLRRYKQTISSGVACDAGYIGNMTDIARLDRAKPVIFFLQDLQKWYFASLMPNLPIQYKYG
ncbi:MAG: hypothetical protein EA396_14745 [Anaerolineaceae bacterium]|nr:MAG: hypothetical protein EA396_14745 [Anaerolineaceae bacterium]